MAIEYFIAARYLKAKRKQAFVSVISMISISGVALGVMALIIVISVMGGFETELKNRILGISSHVMVMRYGGNFSEYRSIKTILDRIDGVKAAYPFIYTQVMLRSASNVSGAILRGIDPNYSSQMSKLNHFVKQGSLKDLDTTDANDDNALVPGIVLGKELAFALDVLINDQIYIISPKGMISPIGHVPTMRRFRVAGIIETGMYEYDSSLSMISLTSAQKLLRMGNTVTGIELQLHDVYHAINIRNHINEKIGYPYFCKDWIQMNGNLFSALKLEKMTMFIILTLIVLVAAFNIASTLIMMVMERTRDIAILKAMGATPRSIRKIFVINGMIIGTVGTFIGSAIGISLCLILKRYQFIKLPDVYYISTLPVRLDFVDISFIALSTLVICFFATLYPSSQAAKLDPVEALRYE